MARGTDSGALTYAGITSVLLVAIAALAVYRYDLFDVRSLVEPSEDGPVAPVSTGTTEDDAPRARDGFPAEPPDFSEHRVEHDTPLPERLVINHRVEGHNTEIELRLVPQGPFIMGRNDGVDANSPQRWVWMDDYYMSTTEITNDQFFAFVLDGGYDDPRHWSQEGFEFAHDRMNLTGSPHIRWVLLDDPGRLMALSAPSDASGSSLTLQVLDRDRVLGEKDRTVLVLPNSNRRTWSEYVSVNRQAGTVSLRDREDVWHTASGQDVRYDRRLSSRGLVYTTDAGGKVDLSTAPEANSYSIIAFADGDHEAPIIGQLSLGDASYLRRPAMPVVGLSWFEADAVCRYFGGNLPTEAQWEKAGRGTDGRIFPWGDDLELHREMVDSYGAHRDTTDIANINRWRIMPVGSFPDGAGPYGHLDLVGNVSEWCRDAYRVNPDGADANPFTMGGPHERRSERGSNTRDDALYSSRLYARRSLNPYSIRRETLGLRIVFDPDTALSLAGRK